MVFGRDVDRLVEIEEIRADWEIPGWSWEETEESQDGLGRTLGVSWEVFCGGIRRLF